MADDIIRRVLRPRINPAFAKLPLRVLNVSSSLSDGPFFPLLSPCFPPLFHHHFLLKILLSTPSPFLLIFLPQILLLFLHFLPTILLLFLSFLPTILLLFPKLLPHVLLLFLSFLPPLLLLFLHLLPQSLLLLFSFFPRSPFPFSPPNPPSLSLFS